MRLSLILNRRSGSIDDPDALVARIRERCDELTVYEVGDWEAAIATHPDRLIVAGGDGSIAGPFAAAQRAGVQFAVLPGGTANDFVRALGLPLDMDEAIELATLPAARVQPTWGGMLGDRPFVNVASIGLAVDAAEHAEEFKPRLGPLAYGVGAVRAGLTAQPIRASLAVNDAAVAKGGVWQLLIGASGHFGGGSGLGEAETSDRNLVAAWVPFGSRLTLPLRAAGLRSRTIERQRGVEWWRGDHLAVQATQHDKPAVWNVDGERWEPETKRIEVRPVGPVDVVVGAA